MKSKQKRTQIRANRASSSLAMSSQQVLLSKEDVCRVVATDTWIEHGKKRGAVVVHTDKRHAFFAGHPNAQRLLQREKENPLLEEGFLNADIRDHEGEYYLTYEALTLLIEAKRIRHHRTKAGGFPYHSKNIFVVKNDVETLEEILGQLVLRDQDDAKLIYIEEIHSVACYIRNDNGTIKCFIADSEETDDHPPQDVLSALQQVFPEALIYISNTRLQKDYFSCATFAFKALLYFVKHGSEIFPWLERAEIEKTRDGSGAFYLASEGLMPMLFKMVQDQRYLALPPAILDSIVSHKRKMSLRDYVREHSVAIHDKWANVAALLKKYEYLSILEHYISEFSEGHSISSNSFDKLPRILSGHHQLYKKIPNTLQGSSSMKKHFIDICLELMNYLEQPIATEPVSDLKRTTRYVQRKFPTFKQMYQTYFQKLADKQKNNWFETKIAPETIRLIKLLYAAALVEASNPDHIDMYLQFAAKLLALFTNTENAIAYLRQHGLPDSRQPIHDACLFRLPPSGDGEWDQPFWAALVMEHGNNAIIYLPWAARLDVLRSNLATTSFTNTLEMLQSLIKDYTYPRAEENPVLAALCHPLLVSEENFNHCLELTQQMKSFDLLPEINISGNDIGPKFNGFLLQKLPIDDLNAFLLGEYTACCQSLGKAAEASVIHGVRSFSSGFYVIYNEKHHIVAQCWAWIGTQGELVFDSFERSHSNKDFLCEPFMEKAAEALIQQGFARVLIGRGNTPKWKKREIHRTEELAKAYDLCSYSDAAIFQNEIAASESRSVVDAFRAYASQTGWSAESFECLFSDEFESGLFERKLIELLERNGLTFSEFFLLLRFCYRGVYDFLHQEHVENQALLTLLFHRFGDQMSSFLLLKNKNNETLIDIIVMNEYMDLLSIATEITVKSNAKTVLSTASNEYVYRLPHSAAKYNSERILQWAYEHYFQQLSWDDYIALPDQNGRSVLGHAALHDQHALIKTTLPRMTNNTVLHEVLKRKHFPEGQPRAVMVNGLLQYTRNKQFNILHYLAEKNDVETFKYLANRIQGSELCELLDEKVCVYDLNNVGWNAPLAIFAFIRQSFDFAHYLMCRYYERKALTSLLVHPTTPGVESHSLMSCAVKEKQCNTLDFLRSVHQDEAHWVETLVTPSHAMLSGNSVWASMRYDNWSIFLYLLKNIASFEHVHQVITHDKTSFFYSIEREEHDGTEQLYDALHHILMRYENHPECWDGVLNLKMAKFIIRQKSVPLFKQFLALVSQKESLFSSFIVQDYFENILLLIFLQLGKNSPETPISLPLIQAFVATLFEHCTPKQIECLLDLNYSYSSWERFFETSPPCLFEYLLELASQIDKEHYFKKWFALERKQIHDLFANRHDDFILTDRLIACYIERHGIDEVNKMLKKNNIDLLCDFIIKYENTRLMHHVYPVICSDLKIYASLLSDIVKGKAGLWLIEQQEMTPEILVKIIRKKIRNIDMSCSETFNCLVSVNRLWDASIKKGLEKALAIEVIQKLFHETLGKIMKCSSYPAYQQVDIQRTVNTFKVMLDGWLRLLPSETVFALISQSPKGKQNVFINACIKKQMDFVFMMLLRCDAAGRQALLERFKSQVPEEQQSILPDLLKNIRHFNQLDELLAFKGQTTLPYTNSSLTLFSHRRSKIFNWLQSRLELLNPEHFFYCDEHYDLRIISFEYIKTLYEEYSLLMPSAGPVVENEAVESGVLISPGMQ